MREAGRVSAEFGLSGLLGKVHVVGIAGHRRFGDAAISRFVARSCHAILREIQLASPACVALSPLAEGADTTFAEAALGFGMALDVVRAHAGFGGDFSTATARRRYLHLRSRARRCQDLAYEGPCDEAFEAAMNQVVEHSDLLVVAWDGGPPGGRGGTAHAVQRVQALGRPWVHLDTARAVVRVHAGTATRMHLPARSEGIHV